MLWVPILGGMFRGVRFIAVEHASSSLGPLCKKHSYSTYVSAGMCVCVAVCIYLSFIYPYLCVAYAYLCASMFQHLFTSKCICLVDDLDPSLQDPPIVAPLWRSLNAPAFCPPEILMPFLGVWSDGMGHATRVALWHSATEDVKHILKIDKGRVGSFLLTLGVSLQRGKRTETNRQCHWSKDRPDLRPVASR